MGIDHRTRRAVFLDRDGVLNQATVRNGKPTAPFTVDELVLFPDTPASVARLHAAGFFLVVVTNQPDIARGTISRAVVDDIDARLKALVPLLDEIRVCPHDDRDNCPCRKPKTGMLDDAAAAHGLSLTDSYLVGDRWRDIGAGQNAGCTTVFIDFGYDERRPDRPDATVHSLTEAVDWILSREAGRRG